MSHTAGETIDKHQRTAWRSSVAHPFIAQVPRTILAGRYVVLRSLGHGSSAAVYLAEDARRGCRQVAVKVFFPLAAEERALDRLLRNEIYFSQLVRSERIVRAYEAGRDGEYPFLVMDYVEGQSLRQLIAFSERKLLMRERIVLLLQLIDAVDAIHRAAVIHCDLKPENVMVRSDGAVLVTDFGVATGPQTSPCGVVVAGSLNYLAPELWQGEAPTELTDLYSVGIMMYELLTALHPFETTSLVATIRKQLEEGTEPPHLVNPAVPEGLSQLILRTLAADPARRPQSARVLYEELFTYLA